MKIVIDARSMGSRPSGIGMYLNDFLRQLIKYEEFEFVLLSDVATSENIKHFMKQGIEVRTQGREINKSVGVYSYFTFVQKQLDDIQPDLFWEVNTVIPVTLKGDFKTMITVHDMFPIDYVEYFGHIYSMYFKHSLKKTLKNTDMILYNSQQTKKTTECVFPEAKKIPSCNGYIISNPLDKEYEISDENYFLYIGNMEKRKGVDLMIKAYAKYREKGGTKPIIFAGKMQEEDIEQLLNETMDRLNGQAASVQERISDEVKQSANKLPVMTYLDYVSHSKKMELYAKCSCFVFPSKAEGFGMPILEVMKFYKPIIVGNLDIFEEIAGSCINDFDLRGSEAMQIENLSEKMFDYDTNVNREEYKEVVSRYAPEKLGEIVRKFITL